MECLEVICTVIFEKISAIPYAVRQFLKALYQAALVKFPKESNNN